MKHLLSSFIKVFFLFSFLSWPTLCWGTSTFLSVVINEVSWMGREEWIELYNNTSEEIDLTNWQIENGGIKNKPLKISQGKIPPKGFFLLCKKQIENCDYKNTGLSLHNDYQTNGPLILKNNLGEIIDETPFSYSKEWPGGTKEKHTMERKNPQVKGSHLENWQTSQNPGGTPKKTNTILDQTKDKDKSQKLFQASKIKESEIKEKNKQHPSQKDFFGKREFSPQNQDTLFPRFLSISLVALLVSFFSAIIILILKRKLKNLSS